ncbi:MAG: AzlD domain-containing protein [Thermoflexales bacterium]
MRDIALLVGMLAVTFFTRFTMIALLGKVDVPLWAQRAFRLVLPAVMMAIVLPQVMIRGGAIVTTTLNPRLISVIIAGVVAWRTRNMVYTLLAGMAVLWACTLLGIG